MTILEKQPALLVNKYIDQVGRHFGLPDFTAWLVCSLLTKKGEKIIIFFKSLFWSTVAAISMLEWEQVAMDSTAWETQQFCWLVNTAPNAQACSPAVWLLKWLKSTCGGINFIGINFWINFDMEKSLSLQEIAPVKLDIHPILLTLLRFDHYCMKSLPQMGLYRKYAWIY